MNRQPFWWPMNEPPLPADYERIDWGIDRVVIDPERDLQVHPEVTIHEAHHEFVMDIARKIAIRDAELLERLAD